MSYFFFENTNRVRNSRLEKWVSSPILVLNSGDLEIHFSKLLSGTTHSQMMTGQIKNSVFSVSEVENSSIRY